MFEQNVRKESDKNDKQYQFLREESNAIKCLQRELETKSRYQEVREQELAMSEQRLLELERNLNDERDQIKTGKEQMMDLTTELQRRNEEITKQRNQLEEREQLSSEKAAQLHSWEEQLEYVTDLLQQGGNSGNGNFPSS